jgi:hypothetical protein
MLTICAGSGYGSSSCVNKINQLRKGTDMLFTIAIILVILWVLGLVTSYTMGGVIHVLLVIAIIIVLVNFIGGRKGGSRL